MLAERSQDEKKFNRISILTVILLAVAYCSHLTVLEIDPRLDEIRRGLVSLEMLLSGNWLVPTINGEPYLNKPPLYNWLLALSYKTFGVNEFALRMPVIAAIFFFGWIIYRYSKQHIGHKAAVLVSLLFITNGRILIYDSLIGLIDILYSSLVFLSFMVVYNYGKKEKWFHAFMLSYLIVVAGFLMKGLPSLVYQAILLPVFFIGEGKWKVLFHKAHFAAILVMVLLLGTYYYFYFNEVNLSANEFVTRLITESTDRTVVNASTQKTILYILGFPLIYIYNFAPWTLFLLLIIRNNWINRLTENHFVRFNAILFFFCSLIYWLSPNSIARYMFMIVPLSFNVAAWYYTDERNENSLVKKWIGHVLAGLLMVLGLGCIVLPFISFTNHLPLVEVKAVFLLLTLGICGYASFKQPKLSLSFIILGFVFVRIGFNWFVVEQRGKFSIEQRLEAEKVMEIAGDRPIYLEKGADHGNPDGLSFNIALKQQRILPLTDSIIPNAVYITDSVTMINKPNKVLYRWASEFQPNHYLVEYTQGESQDAHQHQ